MRTVPMLRVRFTIAVLALIVASTSAADEKKETGLSKTEVGNVVRAHLEKVKDCYERALARNSTLEGTVVIAWTVEPDGHVTGAKVTKSTLKDSDVETCIVGEVASWIFPKFPSETKVSAFPFVFKR
jgi:TonB family protein